MKPQAFIFIGRYGAGKGTQADLLIKKLAEHNPEHPPLYVQTGQEFRNFLQSKGYTAGLAKKVTESGGLNPEFMAIHLWASLLISKYTGKEHLVFDGTPRKLLEAQILKSIFPFYALEKPWVIYLDVEHEESHKRLMLRAQSGGRLDDQAKAIEARKVAYEADVIPTIEYYRTNPDVRFLDVDGERSIEEIHADIAKRLGLS